jgi:hypothetical protein
MVISGRFYVHYGLILRFYVVGIGPHNPRIYISQIFAEVDHWCFDRETLITTEINLPGSYVARFFNTGGC